MPIISMIACDSKLHTRGRIFKGCLGTCLLLDSPDSLNKAYDDFISELFVKHGVERSRSVYKSYDLRKKLSLSGTLDFINTLKGFYTSLLSADIVTRFIDESLASKRLRLVNVGIEDAIKEYGMEKIKIYYIGQSDVANIVPAEKRAIPLHDYLKRPSVFLLSEDIIEKENVWFEQSRVYDKVLNFASKIGGGFKRVEKEQDYKYLLQPDNYVLYQGENGQKKAEYLKNVLDYPINIRSLEEI